MSILLNDNLDVAVTKPVDNRYGPWATTAAAIAGIPAYKRHLGLVVGVVTTGVLSEYWFKDSVADGGLVLKTVAGGVTSVGGVSPDIGGDVDISSVQISAWGGVVTSSVGAVNGVASLDGTGKLTSSQFPTLTTTQLPTLTTAQISNFNLHTVTTAQVVGLDARTDSRIAAATLTTNQVSGLDARVDSRIASGSLTTAQVSGLLGLVTSQISAASISSTQISTIGSSQVTGLTAALATKLDTTGTIPTSQVSGFNAAADARITLQKGAASGLASLDGTGKLTPTQIPDVSLVTYLGSIADQAAMLALSSGEPGDWLTRADLSTTWVLTSADRTQLSSWTQLSYPTAPVTSVAGRTGAVTLTKADVALGNVDNTADNAKSFTTNQITGFNAAASAAAPVQTVAGRAGAVVLTTTDIGGISNLAVTTTQISGLTKTAVGLGNVDNVADANKTFTTAQITGLLGMTTSQIAAAAITTAQVTAFNTAAAAAAPVQTVAGRAGAVVLTTTDIAGYSAGGGGAVTSVAGRTGAVTLTTTDIGGLTSTALSAMQIAGITGLTTTQISNFNQHTVTTAQVTGLLPMVTSQIAAATIGTQQITGLTSVPLSSTQFNALQLTTNQITGLTVVPLTSTQINGITGLTTTQITNFNTHTVTTSQVTGLLPMVTSQIAAAAIGTQQVTGLTSLALTSTQINGITGLTTTQISNFNAHTITTAQVIGLTSFALSSTQVNALTLQTNQIAGLTSFALSSTQINALTGLTTTQITGWAATQNLKANAAAPALTGAGTFATLQGALLTAQQAALTTAAISALTISVSGTAPTVAVDNNSTLIATTAFIQGQKATSNPLMNNAVAIGTSTKWSPQDHVHPVDTSRAPLASPTFTGKVTTAAPVVGSSGFNLPPGTAPTPPADGDVWTTTAGMFVRVAGVTVGPLSPGGGGAATSLAAFATVTSVKEVGTLSVSAPTATLSLNATTQAVYWANASTTANFIVELTTTAGMNTTLSANGESLTIQLITNNGATAYYCTAVQIPAGTVTTNWLGGSAPTAGDPNSKNIYTFQIIKTAANVYTVFASQTRFA
jgi:hypothetical protein